MRMLLRYFVLALSLAVPHVAFAQFAAQQTWNPSTGGTANAIVLSTPNITSLSDLVGVPIRFQILATNTGATTIAVGGTTATAIKKGTNLGPLPLIGGEFIAGNYAEVVLVNVAGPYIITSPPAPVSLTNSSSQFLTTSGTYTPSAGVSRISLSCWGGGGGGGSWIGAGSQNGIYASSGGGGGEYRTGSFDITPGATITYTIGAGGAAASAATNNSGSNGGSTVFGSLMTSNGGVGGIGGPAGTANAGVVSGQATSNGGGAGGTGGSGGLGVPGGAGGIGLVSTGSVGANYDGSGGSSFGSSEQAALILGNPVRNGFFPGGGGAGGFGPSVLIGGSGANGACIVQEIK